MTTQRYAVAYYAADEALPVNGPPVLIQGQGLMVLSNGVYAPAVPVDTTDPAPILLKYSQLSPASIWDIDHTFDHSPDVYVVDSGGSLVIGDVTYPTSTQVRIEFSVPFGGDAFLH